MAKVEEIDRHNYTYSFINLTASVGRHGINNKNDVMVVQALCNYGLSTNGDFAGKLPQPTGAMDRNTRSFIKKLQHHLKKLKAGGITIDGRIDRAKGQFVEGKKSIWTIIHLNDLAQERWLFCGSRNNNYIEDMCFHYPQLVSIIKNNRFGTLDLPIE